MQYHKVELCGVNTAKLPVLKEKEKAALLCQRMVCEWGMLPAGDEPYLFSQGQREAAT